MNEPACVRLKAEFVQSEHDSLILRLFIGDQDERAESRRRLILEGADKGFFERPADSAPFE